MSWLKTDDKMPEHPKVEPLSDAAYRLHSHALHYAARYETDGFIPSAAIGGLTRHRNKQPLLQELLSATGVRPDGAPLWTEVTGGWMIHDFLEYNPSHAEQEAKREKACERMQRVRSREHHANTMVNTARTNAVGSPSPVPIPIPIPSRPDPQREEREEKGEPPTESAPKSKGGSRAKSKSSYPADFAPSQANREYAEKYGIVLRKELEAFEAHARRDDVQHVDWQAAFRVWLGNHVKWNDLRPIPKPFNDRDFYPQGVEPKHGSA